MKIQKVDYSDPKFAEKFITSLKETGFAVISGTSVKQSSVESVQNTWRKFFQSSKEEKNKFLFNETEQAGYFPFLSENAKDQDTPDLKEFYHIFKEKNLPTNMDSKETWSLRNQIMEMGMKLLSVIEKDLGLAEGTFQNSVKGCERTLYRIIYYPALTGKEDGIRAAAHEDINLITLLPAQSSAGLEAKDAQGNWCSVEYEAGDIVVNVGDMLQMFTGGDYLSTTHRVVNPEDNGVDRIAMPVFMHPSADFDLGQMTAGEYLDQRLAEIGLK